MWLRRAIFQVHLWVGVVLTAYAVVIGVSGSALVFRGEIERSLAPELFSLKPGEHRLAYDALIVAAEGRRPGWRVSSLEGFAPDSPVTLLLRPRGGALAANYRQVVVDPYTGAELEDRMRFAGALGWLANLHYYLMAGPVGLQVSGWMSLGLIVLCLSGWVVWWPGVGRWLGALVLRPRHRWRRLTWDLHAVIGFWFALPLLLLSVTGCYFAFPRPVLAIADAVFRSHPAPGPTVRESSSTAPALRVQEAVGRAELLLPREAPLGYFALPARPGGAFSATGYVTGAAPYSQLVSLRLDGHTGALLSLDDTRKAPASRRCIQSFFALHFGSFAGAGAAGTAVKGVWVLVGLAPAALAITGLVLFGLRCGRWRRARHKASTPAA